MSGFFTEGTKQIPADSSDFQRVSMGASSRSDPEKGILVMLEKENQTGISRRFISPEDSAQFPLQEWILNLLTGSEQLPLQPAGFPTWKNPSISSVTHPALQDSTSFLSGERSFQNFNNFTN